MISNEGHNAKTCRCVECDNDRQVAEIHAEIKNGTYGYYGPEGTSARWGEIK